jgi:hypothetical protein
LAFIELPSWLRGSRPYVLEARTDEIMKEFIRVGWSVI